MRVRFALLACLSLSGCAGAASPSDSPVMISNASFAPAQTQTPVALLTEDRGPGCFMMLIGNVRVEGDATAPEGEAVWLIKADGERIWPIWPDGFSAVMDPELRILDAEGQTVVTEGQWFDAGGSFDGEDGAYICAVDERTYT